MHSRVDPQHDDQIDPALGEEVARVPVDDAPTSLALILDGIQ